MHCLRLLRGAREASTSRMCGKVAGGIGRGWLAFGGTFEIRSWIWSSIVREFDLGDER